MPGYGSQAHEDMLNTVRFDAVNIMRKKWPTKYEELWGIADDGLMLNICRHHGIPDCMLSVDGYDGWLIVEIGQCDPDKWGDAPVLRVTLRGAVGIMNPTGHSLETDVVWAIKEAISRSKQPTAVCNG